MYVCMHTYLFTSSSPYHLYELLFNKTIQIRANRNHDFYLWCYFAWVLFLHHQNNERCLVIKSTYARHLLPPLLPLNVQTFCLFGSVTLYFLMSELHEATLLGAPFQIHDTFLLRASLRQTSKPRSWVRMDRLELIRWLLRFLSLQSN